jgi:hypothetical protein
MNGLRRSSILGKKARHLVLTTSAHPHVKNNSERLRIDYKELNKRIRRVTPLQLIVMGYIVLSDLRRYYPNKQINEPLDYEYHRVRTNEVNGVLHIIQVGDFLPYHWVKKQWTEIHHSPNISITEISNENYGQRASYVVTQYVSNQQSSYVRSSMSKNFIYPQWQRDYNELKWHIYHQTIKHSHRKSKFSNWEYEWNTTSEIYAQTLDRGENQTLLFPLEIPSDKILLIREWNKVMEIKVKTRENHANKNRKFGHNN